MTLLLLFDPLFVAHRQKEDTNEAAIVRACKREHAASQTDTGTTCHKQNDAKNAKGKEGCFGRARDVMRPC